MTIAIPAESAAAQTNRWTQLVLGVIAMMAISSPQYTWTLFTGPLNKQLGTTLAELQWTFSLLVILQTWFSPFQAYLVDRFGPRVLISLGALWPAAAGSRRRRRRPVFGRSIFTYGMHRRVRHRHHLCRHYRPDGAVVSGPARPRRRPRRRGLRLRRVFHELPDRQHDQELGLRAHIHGVGHDPGRDRNRRGAMACGCRRTISRREPRPRLPRSRKRTAAIRRREMLKSPVFYLLFVMMSMMSTSGLMVIFNVGPFAKDFGVADVMVLGMAALPLSLTLSRVTNGLTRPFFGWVSDHIGREGTMTLAFSLECGRDPRPVSLHRPAGFVRRSDRIGVLRLGRNLLAVPLDADRHVRPEIRGDQLRLPLYRPGRRLDPRRARGGVTSSRRPEAGPRCSSWSRCSIP